MLIESLQTLMSEAETLCEQYSFSPAIENYETLVEDVVNLDLSNELLLLETLYLDEEEDIRGQFKHLCSVRCIQNQDTMLDFFLNPMLPCNVLYFNIAKLLYPKANFAQLCKILMPVITHEWIVNITAVRSQGAKRARREHSLSMSEVEIGDKAGSIADMPLTPESFFRVLRIGDHVFALDSIEKFDFDIHLQCYRLLWEENRPLLTAITAHNESLAALYFRLSRRVGLGATIRETILPMATRMAVSGKRAGFSAYASSDGLSAAERFRVYYHALPDPLKGIVGACDGADNNPSIETIVHDIENGNCIETAAMSIFSVLENPRNAVVLDTTPYLSDEEKLELSAPYLNFKKGEPIVNVVGKCKTIHLPSFLSARFYQHIKLFSADELVAVLTAFPVNEYESLLELGNFDEISFLRQLNYILEPLNVAQREALITALMVTSVRKNLHLESSRLMAAFVNSDEPLAIEKLTGHLTDDERYYLLAETDEDGKTALHHLAFSSTGIKTLLELYPNRKKTRRAALEKRDDSGRTVWHLAENNAESITTLIEFFLENSKGLDSLIQVLLCKDGYCRTALHYAATNIHALKVLLEYLVDDSDDPEIQEEVIMDILQMADRFDMTVFHYAAVNGNALCYLLNKLSDPTDIVALLSKKNRSNRRVLLCEEKNFPTLQKVLQLLLSKNIENQALIDFMTKPSLHDERSIWDALIANRKGNDILVSLYEMRPSLVRSLRPTGANLLNLLSARQIFFYRPATKEGNDHGSGQYHRPGK